MTVVIRWRLTYRNQFFRDPSLFDELVDGRVALALVFGGQFAGNDFIGNAFTNGNFANEPLDGVKAFTKFPVGDLARVLLNRFPECERHTQVHLLFGFWHDLASLGDKASNRPGRAQIQLRGHTVSDKREAAGQCRHIGDVSDVNVVLFSVCVRFHEFLCAGQLFSADFSAFPKTIVFHRFFAVAVTGAEPALRSVGLLCGV